MATTIVTKSGSGAPTASDLVAGELAVDLTNKRLYTEDSGGTVLELGTNPASDVTFGDNTKAIFGAGSDLQIYSDGTTGQVTGNVNVTGTVTADGLTVDGNIQVNGTNAGQLILDATGQYTQVVFEQNGSSNSGGDIIYDHTDDIYALRALAVGDMQFKTSAVAGTALKRQNIASNGDISFYEDTGTTPKFFWDASAGNLLVGKTAASFSVNGVALGATGLDANGWNSFVTATPAASGGVQALNRKSSDGIIQGFYKDGAAVGSIGTASSHLYIGNLTTNLLFHKDDNHISPWTGSAYANGTKDLGKSDARFKDLYLSGSADIGKTGSAGVLLLNRSSDGGAAGALSISGDDFVMNTGYASGDLIFKNAINESLRIAASGKVGLNVTAPTDQLEINGAAAYPHIRLRSSVNTSRYMRIGMTDSTTHTIEANGTGTSLAFITAGSERARIDDLGNLLVGGSTAGARLHITEAANKSEANAHFRIAGAGYSGFHWLDATAYYIGQNSGGRSLRLYSGAETSGVNLANGGTSWGTFSDERLKYDVEPIENALESLSNLRTVKYRLAGVDAPDSQKKLGLMAQDLVGALDEIIDPIKLTGDETEYMSVRYTEMVPVLVKAIQEQQATIEALTARIAALES